MKLLFLLIGVAFAAAVNIEQSTFPQIKWIDPNRYYEGRGNSVHLGRVEDSGERPALDGEVAYQVGIFADRGVFCGGALISERAVLTAAHCIDGRHIWEIYLGTNDLSLATENSMRVLVSMHAVLHEDYDVLTNANAVGLIILPDAVTFADKVSPVLLPKVTQQDKWENKDIEPIVSGWGITSRSELANPTVLNVTKALLVSNSACEEIYGSDAIFSSTICLGIQTPNPGPCPGDAGGPIVIDDNGEKVLIGIVSWGPRQECRSTMPQIATSTTSYLKWIADHGGPNVRP
ncbi:brachyurin-like [Neocloeon triangulifer]|uniref:brachyurin-like n=1 Tax=Neocloeon triangulifer TaxID=2078957 RepID=UPI00286EB98F|nr:brachyurin-like [Neocloeon triangulifer]